MEQPLHLTIPGDTIADISEFGRLKEKYTKLGKRCLQNGFDDSHFAGKLHSLSDGTLLATGQRPKVTDWSGASLREDKNLGIGRRESVNRVQFGQLLAWSGDALPVHELVAAKYLPVERAVREMNAMTHIRNKGGDTYSAVAFLKHNRGVYSLTEFRSDVISLDNILWLPKDSVTAEQVEQAAILAGRSLGQLHGEFAMTHGDAQPKNIAYNSTSNEQNPVHIDLDGARHHEYNSHEVWYRMEEDVKTFAEYQPRKLARAAIDSMIDAYVAAAQEGGDVSLTADSLHHTLSNTTLKRIAYQDKESKFTNKTLLE